MIAGRRGISERDGMSDRDFADFYARYVARCIGAGVQPTTSARAVALLLELGLWPASDYQSSTIGGKNGGNGDFIRITRRRSPVN